MKNFRTYFRVCLFSFLLILFCKKVFAQEYYYKVSGIVLNEEQVPLKNVKITFEADKFDVSTSWDGIFEVQVNPKINKLKFECLGYSSKTINVAEKTDSLIVVLERDNHQLDKVIDLGYSSSSLQNLTGSVSTITGAVLEKHPVANLAQTFAGRFSGLTTQESFSEPSRVSTGLLIRGISAARHAEPLVIIDGIPTSFKSSQTLEYISPNEIESISILKDGSTQAIYGIQGANGVISIRTKRGLNQTVEIKARLDHSIQQGTTKPLVINSLQFAELRNQAGFNDGLGNFSQFSEKAVEHYRKNDAPDLYPSNNWFERYFRDFSDMKRIGVNVTGGNDKVTYFSNLNFMRQGGYFNTESTDYDANPKNTWINYRSNINLKFNKYLSGYLRLSGNIKREYTPSGGSNDQVYASMLLMPPTAFGPLTTEIKNEKGEVIVKAGEVVTTERVGSPTYGLLNRSGFANHTVTNINSQFGLDLDLSFLLKGLNLTGVFAYQTNSVGSLWTTQDYERYMRTDNWEELAFVKKGVNNNTPLSYSKSNLFYYHLTYKGQLNYQRQFGDHSIQAFAFGLYQDLSKDNTNPPDFLPYRRLSTGSQIIYNYDNRYILNGGFGYSGSEQYARSHRYIYTPTVSASWIASNESFFKNTLSWVSLFKIRGSWAKTGNDQSGLQRYAYLDQINVNPGGPIGYLQYILSEAQTGNPNIQAEVSTKYNLGLDLGLFNSITFTGDLFKERMENMIVSAVSTIPSYQGIPLGHYPRLNEGIFENRGYELGLRFDKTINDKTSFYIEGMYSKNRNTIISWNEAKRTEDFKYRLREEGNSYGQQFGYLVDYTKGNGFFNSQAEIDESGLEYAFGKIRVGDLRYQDLNEDGIIDLRDVGPLGNGIIPRVTYSFSGGLVHREFDLNFIFQGLGDYSTLIWGDGIWETSSGGMFSSLHQNAWTEERFKNGQEITWPALSTEKSVSHEGSDFINFNKSYLRLRNLELGYTFKRSLTSKLGIDQIRLVLSGQNLLTWDKMKSKDFGPEGGGYLSFPVYRVYNFGINLVL